MQFTYEHKAGEKFATVKFVGDIFKLKVTESFELSFQRIGGKYLPEESTVDCSLWRFPSWISSSTIYEIISNTCYECGGLMKDGEAFDNAYVSSNDFGNDAGSRGTTMSKSGQAELVKVRKCISCGHSHT